MGLVKFAGKCLLLAVLVHVGWNLLQKPTLQKETSVRLRALWDLLVTKVPQLSQHSSLVLAQTENVVKGLTWVLLASPVLLVLRS